MNSEVLVHTFIVCVGRFVGFQLEMHFAYQAGFTALVEVSSIPVFLALLGSTVSSERRSPHPLEVRTQMSVLLVIIAQRTAQMRLNVRRELSPTRPDCKKRCSAIPARQVGHKKLPC